MKFKSDWAQAKEDLIRWWDRKGLAVSVAAKRDVPMETLPQPAPVADPQQAHCDAAGRTARNIYNMANTFYGGVAAPMSDCLIGPGSLSTFLGCQPHFSKETVWYDPCISDPDKFGPIRFSPKNNEWWDIHMGLIREGARQNKGRYLVGMPDLIENMDTLASMRGSQPLLMDMMERPQWVKDRLAEINEAYFAAFDLMYEAMEFEGGNAFVAFGLWGPGKTAKVQCDISCMISPAMYKEFVVPSLKAQCDWLDYSMYHLDGEDAMQHLDALLSIDSLDAIEWTPVGASGAAGKPQGGDPVFYDLYRRIKKAGKSVQAIGVQPDQLAPLLDAVGPEGMYVMCWSRSQADAEKLLATAAKYK